MCVLSRVLLGRTAQKSEVTGWEEVEAHSQNPCIMFRIIFENVPWIVLREHFGGVKHLYRQCGEILVYFSTLQLKVNIVTF